MDPVAANAAAVVTKVNATGTTAASYFLVGPAGLRPLASAVNWLAGQTVPNLTVVTPSRHHQRRSKSTGAPRPPT
ncbi:MAG: hypothetical protein ACYCX9_09125 [Candidatus Dormibacteria bacterium]